MQFKKLRIGDVYYVKSDSSKRRWQKLTPFHAVPLDQIKFRYPVVEDEDVAFLESRPPVTTYEHTRGAGYL